MVRRVSFAKLLILLSLSAIFISGTATAADEAPVPSDATAGDLFIAVDQLGEGWTLVTTTGLEFDADVFTAGSVAIYTGPGGARVLAVALLVTQERVAIRRSWEAADGLFDNYSGELAYLSGRVEELNGEPPPSGCVEAKRIDGTAKQLGIDTGIPLGITLCAADPDVIVLVAASGNVLDLTGFAASDAIVSMMLATRVATPVAQP